MHACCYHHFSVLTSATKRLIHFYVNLVWREKKNCKFSLWHLSPCAPHIRIHKHTKSKWNEPKLITSATGATWTWCRLEWSVNRTQWHLGAAASDLLCCVKKKRKKERINRLYRPETIDRWRPNENQRLKNINRILGFVAFIFRPQINMVVCYCARHQGPRAPSI